MHISKIEVLSIITKVVILILLIVNLVQVVNGFQGRLPIPVAISISEVKEDTRVSEMKVILKDLGCPKEKINKMADAVIKGADDINVDPKLIAALIRTESDFDMNAVSNKGYKGLMQTPIATKQWADVDVLIGCKILQEKLGYAKGDIRLALALYKGGNNSMAHRQAEQVIKLYKQIKGEG